MSDERLKKRGRIWYAWVPHPDGGTQLLSTRCTDKEAARKAARELERRHVDPGYAAAQTTTVRELVSRYLASRVRLGRSEGTLHHVETKAGHLARLLPEFCASLTHEAMEKYIDARLGEGVRRTTIKKELRVFGGAWALGARNRLVGVPLEQLMPELHDDYEPRKRALTAVEAYGLCLALPPERAAVVVFAIATGAEWSAVKRAQRVDIAVDGSLVALHGTKRKTRERVTPLPLPTQRAMVLWALANGDGPGEKLFSAWTNVRRDLHVACAKVGIPPCSPNDLRRTYGTWLRDAGVEPQLIAPAMGHVDSRMVERVYGRFTPESLARNLAAAVRSPVGHLSDGGAETGGKESTPDDSSKADSSVKQDDSECPGTESNRRHGDFQSNEIARRTPTNSEISDTTCRANVDLVRGRNDSEEASEPCSACGPTARYRIHPNGDVEPLNEVARARRAAWDALRSEAA
jgi:integrase